MKIVAAISKDSKLEKQPLITHIYLKINDVFLKKQLLESESITWAQLNICIKHTTQGKKSHQPTMQERFPRAEFRPIKVLSTENIILVSLSHSSL